jgi:hypothetical protein
MPGLVPGIHAVTAHGAERTPTNDSLETWMAGTSLAMTAGF